MASESNNAQATCFGCNVNYNWAQNFKQTNFSVPHMEHDVSVTTTDFSSFVTSDENGLTTDEMAILQKLSLAWGEYSKIEKRDSSLREFNEAIHRCQQLIALRVARRVNPEIWAS